MDKLTTIKSKVYLLQINKEHTLDDGRSKQDHVQQAWIDDQQAIKRLLGILKNDIESRVMGSLVDEHWGGISLDIRKVDGVLKATLTNHLEFETEHVSYEVSPLEIQDDYEF